jgi:hypothetical protein
VRFTPAADFKGAGSFTFAAGDQFPHAKQIFHYNFEQANPTSGNRVADASTQDRKATVDVIGLAALTGDTNAPPALSRYSTQSLRFSATGIGAARLSRQVYPRLRTRTGRSRRGSTARPMPTTISFSTSATATVTAAAATNWRFIARRSPGPLWCAITTPATRWT